MSNLNFCHSRNEFTDEFIDLNLNLINVCDIHTYIQTLWLLESLDLLDCETKNVKKFRIGV